MWLCSHSNRWLSASSIIIQHTVGLQQCKAKYAGTAIIMFLICAKCSTYSPSTGCICHKRWNTLRVPVCVSSLSAASSRHITVPNLPWNNNAPNITSCLESRPRGQWTCTLLLQGDSGAVASSSSSQVCCCVSSTLWLWRPGCRSHEPQRRRARPGGPRAMAVFWTSASERWRHPTRRRLSHPRPPNHL